jgi:prepilin-type N-terminal cleavage/methylation domain-containing protein
LYEDALGNGGGSSRGRTMQRHGTTRTAASRRKGFTLVELAIGITVLLVGVLGFAQTLVALERTQARTREAGRAAQAARGILERIQAEAFPEAFRRFNADGGDDPGGVNTAPGKDFAVDGLSAQPDDPDGLPGEVIFPTTPGFPGELRESAVDAALGMPRDLNGDGAIHATQSYATDYVVLPVRVRVAWIGTAGRSEIELRTILGNYR